MDNGGERELVLGNKQLLAIFFVAALLCGVFFAVGYVVGGNSAKAGAPALADGAPASDSKHEEPPSTADNASTPASSAAPSNTATSAPGDSGGSLPSAEPMVGNNPAAAGSQPPPMQPAPAPYQPAPKPAAQATPAAKPPAIAARSAATGVYVSVPEAAASYWQIEAIERPTADDLVKTLREGKLPAILAESPKAGLFRVLVGPYRSQLTLADSKKKLSELGFNSPIIQKY